MDLATDINRYKENISGHPLFNAAYKKLRKSIRHAVKGNIIFVYGPTGVGKSTLLKRLMKEILEESSEETKADASIMPIVRIEAAYPSSKLFSWVEFYRGGLVSLQEPLIDKKYKKIPTALHTERIDSDPKVAGHALKVSFFKALVKRKTKVLLIDEAHHIAKGFEGDKLIQQLEYLKSMANTNEIIIVLAGIYDLIDFLNKSGQLSRRGRDVDFPRYKIIIEQERKQFITVVKAFKKQSPLVWEDEILGDIPYLYTYSAGCIGILKEWIDRAHMEALDESTVTLSLKHLQVSALSIEKVVRITEEMVQGEKSLEPRAGDLQKIQALLGIDITAISTEQKLPLVKPIIKKINYKRRVGIRNAKRDVIGKKGYEFS
jgi:energy-coupling factor transporter ATP-binding protein EcfA2